MKATVILSLASFALGNILNKRECSGNNCNRQVTGTRDGLTPIASRKADCTNYQKVVATASAVTTTVTASPDQDEKEKRDDLFNIRAVTDSPKVVPAYASSCDQAGEYASACSCWGITAWTTTTTPTVTVTATADVCEEL